MVKISEIAVTKTSPFTGLEEIEINDAGVTKKVEISSLLTAGGHTIQEEGTPLTARTNLNFVGAGLTATDGGAGPDSTIVTLDLTGLIVDADVNAAANINATKLGTGIVDNTEFNLLNGLTGTILTDTNAVTVTNKTINDFTNFVGADELHFEVRNVEGSTINKGDAIAITGYNAGLDVVEVVLAKADDPTLMPAVGLVEDDSISNNQRGHAVISGRLSGFDTNSFTVPNPLYISTVGTTGNTLTETRPTGISDGIQIVARVLRKHASLGEVEIFGAGRSNALSNLEDGKLWVGNVSNQPIAVTMSGDATMDNAGAVTIAAGAVEDSMLASTFLKNVVEDITPQLGGNLDAQIKNITSVADIVFDTSTGGTAGNSATYMWGDAGGLNFNAPTGDDITYRINGAIAAQFSATIMSVPEFITWSAFENIHVTGSVMEFTEEAGGSFVFSIFGADALTMNGTTADFHGDTLTDILDITAITSLNGVAIGDYAITTDNLSVFAATTSAQLEGIITDNTGDGALVFSSNAQLQETIVLTAEGLEGEIDIRTYDAAGSRFIGRYANGSIASPTAAILNDVMVELKSYGWNGVSAFGSSGALKSIADGTFSATSTPNRWELTTVPVASTTPVIRMSVDNAGDFDFKSGAIVSTGIIDLGGAASLEIPNGATPVVNADGEIAIDTTVTDWSHGIVKYFSGEEMAVVAMPIAEFITPLADGFVKYNAANDEFELASGGSGGATDSEVAIPLVQEVPEDIIAYPDIHDLATASAHISGMVLPDGASASTINLKTAHPIPDDLATSPAARIEFAIMTKGAVAGPADVRLTVSSLAVADTENFDQAFTAETEATVTMPTATETSDVYSQNMTTDPVAGDTVLVKLQRDPTDASDDFTDDIQIISATLYITRST